MIRAYKLLRVRRDGTLGSLFIDRDTRLPLNKWMKADAIRTRGFAFRPGWHALPAPYAPHLSTRGRQWYVVQVRGVTEVKRPQSQGGAWYLARQMRILGPVCMDGGAA